jgi:hypothetical protein
MPRHGFNTTVAIAAAVVIAMTGGAHLASAPQRSQTSQRPPSLEHVPGPQVERIEAQRYWYYELLGRVRDVKPDPDFTWGVYMDRQRPVQFSTPSEELRDAAQRAKGYIEAMVTILGYMAPRAIPDNEANRRYLLELTQRMQKVTGQPFAKYDEWRNWFKANRDYLVWSEERQLLLSKREQP